MELSRYKLPEELYDICDGDRQFTTSLCIGLTLPSELGILVWQDFMFGCGQYPAYDSLVHSVEIEAEQNVKRIRHHPSLVIFGE